MTHFQKLSELHETIFGSHDNTRPLQPNDFAHIRALARFVRDSPTTSKTPRPTKRQWEHLFAVCVKYKTYFHTRRLLHAIDKVYAPTKLDPLAYKDLILALAKARSNGLFAYLVKKESFQLCLVIHPSVTYSPSITIDFSRDQLLQALGQEHSIKRAFSTYIFF